MCISFAFGHPENNRDNSFVRESKEVVCPRVKGKSFVSFCWQRKENMSHKFMHLLQAISFRNDTPVQQLQICSFAFIGLQLRDALSRFSRVSVTQEKYKNSGNLTGSILLRQAFFQIQSHPQCGPLVMQFHFILLYFITSLALG